MINCAIIMGRLTAEPELRTTTNGTSVTSFSVAVDRNYQKAGAEKQTDFINVVAWRQTAEFVTRYFHKGSMIALQGSIQTRNYEDRDGNKRTAVEILADQVSFCGSKAEQGNGNAQPAPNPYAAPAMPANTAAPAANPFANVPTMQPHPTSFATASPNDFSSIGMDDEPPF